MSYLSLKIPVEMVAPVVTKTAHLFFPAGIACLEGG